MNWNKWKEKRPRSLFLLLCIQGGLFFYPLFQRISLAMHWDTFTAGLMPEALASMESMASLFTVAAAICLLVFLLLFSGWQIGFVAGVIFYAVAFLMTVLSGLLIGSMILLALLLLLLQPANRIYFDVFPPKPKSGAQ